MREALPRLAITPAEFAGSAPIFAHGPSEIWLEIGFGGGEHLLAQAAARPDIGFIGCEPFVNGVAKLLAGLEELRLSNVRIHAGDAGALFEAMSANFLSRVFCLYPDPWPKRRHNKRRVISSEMVEELARILRPRGELRFASDIDDYCGWALRRILEAPAFRWRARQSSDWREAWPEWRSTRYEAKAQRAGRTSSYLTFQRV